MPQKSDLAKLHNDMKMSSNSQASQENGDAQGRVHLESPVRQAVLDSQFPSGTFSGSKSWCSSPFSNLEEIHEDNSCSSLSFHLDFSPGVAFSSPRFKTDLMSPSSGNKSRDMSLFSPSIFSPFNKSMKNKGDSSKALEMDFLDNYDIASTNPSSTEKITSALGASSESYRLDMQQLCVLPSIFQEQLAELPASSPPLAHKSEKARTPKSIAALPSIPSKSAPSTPAQFSSPTVVLRRQQPANMSPDLNAATTRVTQCNCKKSKCLKLYCECFSALKFCSGCNCFECHNTSEFAAERQDAIKSTMERKASAFQSKVTTKAGHTTGCNCKKSQCLKKYCECFEGSVYCGANCKCYSCQNFQDSKELEIVRRTSGKRSTKESPSSVVAASTPVTPPPLHPTVAIPTSTEEDEGSDEDNSSSVSDASPINHSGIAVSPGKRLRTRAVASALKNEANSSSPTSRPLKKRRVKFMMKVEEPLYPFFATPITKLSALRILEHLDGKCIYTMSTVNKLWSKAALDDALWD